MSAELLLIGLGAASGMAAAGVLVSKQPESVGDGVWLDLSFGRDLDADGIEGLMRSIAADRGAEPIVFETASAGGKTRHRVGMTKPQSGRFLDRLQAFAPTVTAKPARRSVPDAGWAWSVRFETRYRPLRFDQAETVTRTLLAALGAVAASESVTVQWIVGPRLAAMSVPNSIDHMPSGSTIHRLSRFMDGEPQGVDSERRRALRDKVTEPGFRATCRIAVTTNTQARARGLAVSALAALRVAEGPGVRLRLRRDSYKNAELARAPWRWPLSVNVVEAAALIGWPVGDADYPGLDRSARRPVRASKTIPNSGRIVADSTYPGVERPLALTPEDSLLHVHVIGPTGVGKSTELLNLVIQDIDADRAVVIVDPKGDLIEEVVARIPTKRRDDVVVLDPADAGRPVGLNPLRPSGRMPELVADQVLAVFHGLYRDSWGPRTQDILHASLLSLIGRDDATLCALPVLLSDASYRRKVVGGVGDEIALRPFWAWFESISDAERQQAIAPVMNKLRAFLLRPRMRAVLGQANPAFDMADVFRHRKILLVSLAKGLLGPEASALLGSLVVSQLWNATLARVAIPAARRHPVMCFIDEFQDYLHLPTDLTDVLAQARGLGLGLTLAHQHLAQLTPQVRQAVLANARSRVCFQLGADDAKAFAQTAPGLDVEDFMSLGRFEVYAALAGGGQVSGFASGRTRTPEPRRSDPAEIRALSRDRYGRDSADVEAELVALLGGAVDVDGNEHAIGRRPRRNQ